MVGIRTKWDKVQLSVTIYPEHARIIEKILRKEYSKPIAHKNASEVIRKAIEYYADYLGVRLNDN
ncbi:ribbon-helix-helix domain-containing protein [Archaeoglobus profundus]|uniref:Uncharacterized protein n=1 Tax=Archaeoglobus profundus (strain DSM 5631 / JCM 9629 / NBRC 100127 / Av18) TaxID=572546 RepID=D2RI84_ARCPA|nr:hypothetical protein [Archaeoglobus profundus]ADB58009.1 hypothetical protein Arcpr_0948 [Archaeoglobus profundus DSM 5631]